MRKTNLLFAAIIISVAFSINAFGQAKAKSPAEDVFDAKLAKKLGADEYGMKSYVLVVLKTGPNDSKITDKAEREKMFAGHFANMKRLAKEGKLAFAGPFVEGKPKRGLQIYAVATLKEAEELVKTDPTVKAGIFVYEMTKLYGSAALMQVREIHDTIAKTKFD